MKPVGGRQQSYANPYGPSDGLGAGAYGYHGGPPPIHAAGGPVYHGRQSPSQQGVPPPSGGYERHAPMPPSSGAQGRPRNSGGAGQLPELGVQRAGGASGHHAHQQYAGPGAGQRIGHLPMMNAPRGSYGGHMQGGHHAPGRGHAGGGHHAGHQYQASGVHPAGHHAGGYHGGGRSSAGGGGHQGAQVRLPQVHMCVAPANYRRMH